MSKNKGVGYRAMGKQAARVSEDREEYKSSLDQAAKDFVSLNPGLDCNDPENLERAWKNFVGNFSPNNPSQKLRKFVFTPTLSSTNSRTLRVFLFALLAAGMVTKVNAEVFQENLGKDLIGGGGDSVPAPKSSATLPPPVPARVRSGNLRRRSHAPTLPSSSEPADRGLVAKPTITQSQLLDYVNAQRDPANPDKMISLAALTETFATDGDGLLVLPTLGEYSSASSPKLPLRNIDFTSARLRSAYFENADLSGSKMTGKNLGSSFLLQNCDLSKTDFDRTSGSIKISGTSDCSGASFQGARFAQRFGVVYPGEEVTGLDLAGATVTVIDGGVVKETISATSPLVVGKESEEILKVAAVPGMALQVGAAGRPIEVKLKSDVERCPTSEHLSVVSPLKLEEFAKTLNEQFRGYNIAATTNSSEADGASVVKSEINLCETPYGTSSDAKFFPQLSTQILLDKDLSPEGQQLALAESTFRAFGISPDASHIRDLTYKMYKETWPNPELPPQSPGYLPAMIHKYFEEFAGRDPALAGCTLSVGLNPGEFKVVAGNVEMAVNPKICDKENEFGFTCHFNQRAGAISNRMRVEDMSVSLSTIEKDGEVVGYVMAVDGMKQVAGVATADEMRCPPPPTPPTPPAPPTPQRRRDETDMGVVFGAMFGSSIAAVCCCFAICCRRRRNPNPAAAPAIGMPPFPQRAVGAIAAQPAMEVVEAIVVNPDGSAAIAVNSDGSAAIAVGRHQEEEIDEEFKVAADGSIVRAPHAALVAPGRNDNRGI